MNDSAVSPIELLQVSASEEPRHFLRRDGRLSRIVEMLHASRLVTGRELASALGVHVRTVYRDVRDLVRSGVPIEGEAGLGYTLDGGSCSAPLVFGDGELEAVIAGVRAVIDGGDQRLRGAASRALTKIEAARPRALVPCAAPSEGAALDDSTSDGSRPGVRTTGPLLAAGLASELARTDDLRIVETIAGGVGAR